MRLLYSLIIPIALVLYPFSAEASGPIVKLNDQLDFTKQERRPDIDPGEGECPDCPPVLVISINGVPGKDEPPADGELPGKDFHDWVRDNIPSDNHTPWDPDVSGCAKNPVSKERLDAIHDMIDQWKSENPCGIVVVIGHSMGAITTNGLDDGRVDCKQLLDPPLKWCGFFSNLFCPAQRAACRAKNGGIMDDPNYHEWEFGPNGVDKPHYPWHPQFNDPNHPDYTETDTCSQLNPVKESVMECLGNLAPNCPSYQGHGPYVCNQTPESGMGLSGPTCSEQAVEEFLDFLTLDDILYLEELEQSDGAFTLILAEISSSCDL